jgi:hypothetical protein
MVMALPPAMAASVNKTAMIRAAHPHEIRLLPQIENAADRRYARAGLQLVVDMPAHSIAVLEDGRRRSLLWVAVSPLGRVVGFALMTLVDLRGPGCTPPSASRLVQACVGAVYAARVHPEYRA